MKVLIRPKKLKGNINVVPSKSYSHRAIIAASLAEGKSIIRNVLFSDDINRTIAACEAFGAIIEKGEDFLTITGAGGVKRVCSSINVGESGSTIRFMIPILLVNKEPMEFLGENHLNKRPLDPYFKIFDDLNIQYSHPSDASLPLKTSGSLKPETYEVPGDVSSQFITGLLFALPLLKGDSILKISTKLESKAYIALTLDILKKFGIRIQNDHYDKFYIPGDQHYKPFDYTIEGDFSQAAFFLAMGALGNDVKLGCMNLGSLQGDRKITMDIEELSGHVCYQDEMLYALERPLKGTTIDLSQSPDLGPVLSVLASVSEGDTTFTNATRLRLKECDRIECMKQELNKLGAKVTDSPSEMYFTGVSKLHGSLELNAHNDHRIAMSLAVASTICDSPLLIDGAECVKKSYPEFWEDFKKLGGDFDVQD